MKYIKLFENYTEEASKQLTVYRGGFLDSKPPTFWSTDINVAFEFLNECRYIVNNKYVKSYSDIEDLVSWIEPYEGIDYVIGWDVLEALKGDDRLPRVKEWIQDNIGKKITKLIVTVNPKAGLIQGVTNFSNPLVLDFQGKIWGETGAVIEHYFPEAREKNCDSMIVNNIIEGGLGRPIGETPGTTFVEMKPNIVINKEIIDIYDYPEKQYY